MGDLVAGDHLDALDDRGQDRSCGGRGIVTARPASLGSCQGLLHVRGPAMEDDCNDGVELFFHFTEFGCKRKSVLGSSGGINR